jgi:hypothetical protein
MLARGVSAAIAGIFAVRCTAYITPWGSIELQLLVAIFGTAAALERTITAT